MNGHADNLWMVVDGCMYSYVQCGTVMYSVHWWYSGQWRPGESGCSGSIIYHCISCSPIDIVNNMSGFDDDFGEMVGEKEAPAVVEDVLVPEDPAAEFLAREQEQLGDLESEIGPLSGTRLTNNKKVLIT